MHGELPKPQLTQTAPRTARGRCWLATALVLLAVAGALAYVYYPAAEQPTNRRSRYAASGPVPVLVAEAKRADVPVYLETVGTARALNTVTVRPQVDGKLMEVTFKEGQDVKKGDVLARIDPTLYRALLDQAIAKKAQDEALLANAKNDLERYERLAASNAVNRQQVDTQKALVAQYTAQVQADQAAIENAQATLGYTTVTAPIDGRTGIRMVDEGNIVRAGDTNSALVTITEVKPIAVTFNVPQQDLQKVVDAFAKGPLKVDAQRSDTNAVVDSGSLKVIDNQVDPTTGTVRLKAEFPNADLQLWPGQFTNVRLLVDTLRNVVVIPTGAVQRGPDGTFIYVVTDGKAAMKPIRVLRQDENQVVVGSGIEPPAQVVTTGFARLTDGSAVTVSPGDGTPQQGQPPSARPRNGEAGAAVGSGAPRERRARGEGNARPAPPR